MFLSSRSKTTSTAIGTLDSHLSRLATERAASKQQLEEHEAQLQANLKEVNEKNGGRSNDRGWAPRGGSKPSGVPLGPTLSQGSNVDDMMEIDEPRGGPLSPQGDSKSKKTFK